MYNIKINKYYHTDIKLYKSSDDYYSDKFNGFELNVSFSSENINDCILDDNIYVANHEVKNVMLNNDKNIDIEKNIDINIKDIIKELNNIFH